MSETPSNITWSAILNYFRAEKKSLVANDPAEIKTLYETNANTNAFTDADVTKLGGIEEGADVTDVTNVGASANSASDKPTPVDADTIPLNDSADSNILKKVSWANIKARLKTYFDGLYLAITGGLVSGTITMTSTSFNKFRNQITSSARVAGQYIFRSSTATIDPAETRSFDISYTEGLQIGMFEVTVVSRFTAGDGVKKVFIGRLRSGSFAQQTPVVVWSFGNVPNVTLAYVSTNLIRLAITNDGGNQLIFPQIKIEAFTDTNDLTIEEV